MDAIQAARELGKAIQADSRYKDYVWHWFLLNGYDDSAASFLVKAVTYSAFEWLDFGGLWDTGYRNRGGLVLYDGL